MIDLTLILFAGMPGSGKTTLARMVAQHLKFPIFSKDRVQRVLRDLNISDKVFPPRTLLGAIDRAKNAGIGPDQYQAVDVVGDAVARV